MAAKVHQIRVEHSPVMYDVEPIRQDEPQHLTLLELVEAVADVTDDEQEIIATVFHMLESGSVKLTGNFRDEPIERLVS
ncbi:MAG: hypothetical protein OEV20_10910 [Actinomycetota bacterium]|nr:hypothetical protein [Actinomycetota bacterium]